MKKFLLTYWLGILLLFILFYSPFSPLSPFINGFQTSITSVLTSFSLEEGRVLGNRIFITDNYALVIEHSCNGMIPFLIFLASILAFPAKSSHKLKWILIGYVLISFVNIFRIWLITQLVIQEQRHFSLAHDYLGNALLIITGLVLFVVFIKTREKSTAQSSLNPSMVTPQS